MFEIVTDSSSNLSAAMCREAHIRMIPFPLTDGKGNEFACDTEDLDRFGRGLYQRLRTKEFIRTSMINPFAFRTAFEKLLRVGKNAIYVGLSGGVSGTCGAAAQAAEELKQDYPGQEVAVVDSLGAGMGEGMLALLAARLRAEGHGFQETLRRLLNERSRVCQIFTVDDLMYLNRSGRLSGISAMIGTLGRIKPLLKGDGLGRIVGFGKCIGRKKAIRSIAELYPQYAAEPETGEVWITHGDCPEDAEYLEKALSEQVPGMRKPRILMHEAGTGTHVGPGMLSLFFFGKDDAFRRETGWLQSEISRIRQRIDGIRQKGDE